jgi:N6-adenosine-specific RNA methylase IME4
MTEWEGLTPPYSTVVIDPPWPYQRTSPPAPRFVNAAGRLASSGIHAVPDELSSKYSSLTLEDIKALPLSDLAGDTRLFMWTTSYYLRESWGVVEAWGFTPASRILIWCKAPRGTAQITTEYVIVGKRGRPPALPWMPSNWYQWPLQPVHSQKPDAFMDLVESWCPGPYVELFCRRPRFGWDSWGHGYEIGDSASL